MNKRYNNFILRTIKKNKSGIYNILKNEMTRQNNIIELKASENYPSDAVMAAAGSLFCCKYTEGYAKFKDIGNSGRYYASCENYDLLENYGLKVFRKLFNAPDYYFNLQPHSGSSANCIAYSSVLNIGDTILSMGMESGGHLSHSSSKSFVTHMYNVVEYNVDENGVLNYEDILRIAKEIKPKLIVCGASAYPLEIDFEEFHKIAKEVNAYLMADISHISTLCAYNLHKTPFGVCDLITFTTQKIFRGNRGGVIACKPELAKQVDSSCFPFWQGGSLQNMIAAKIVAAEEASKPSYYNYLLDVVKNAKSMRDVFSDNGFDVTDTSTHMFNIDFTKTHPHVTGKMVQDALEKIDIAVNKNMVPGDKRGPKEASGIRIGTPAMTTRGWKEHDFAVCAHRIMAVIDALETKAKLKEVDN